MTPRARDTRQHIRVLVPVDPNDVVPASLYETTHGPFAGQDLFAEYDAAGKLCPWFLVYPAGRKEPSAAVRVTVQRFVRQEEDL